MTFLIASSARCQQFRQALAELDGLPRRSTVTGGPDRLPLVYVLGAAGWTDQAVDVPLDGTGQAVLEVPPEYEKHLGKTSGVVTLPARAAGVEEANLPVELRDKVRERKGQKPDGTPRDPGPAMVPGRIERGER